MRARDVKDDLVSTLVWEKPDAMAYVKLGARYMNAQRFEALPRHERALKIMYAERSRATVYRAWRLRKEEWGIVMDHMEEGLDTTALQVYLEAVYVFNLAKYTHHDEVDRYLYDWLCLCMLLWLHDTRPFSEGTKVWCKAMKFDRRQRTRSEFPFFVRWNNREFFLVPSEEKRR